MKTEKANILLILTDHFSHFNNFFLWKSERDFQWFGITDREKSFYFRFCCQSFICRNACLFPFCMQPIPKSKLETDNILLTLWHWLYKIIIKNKTNTSLRFQIFQFFFLQGFQFFKQISFLSFCFVFFKQSQPRSGEKREKEMTIIQMLQYCLIYKNLDT